MSCFALPCLALLCFSEAVVDMIIDIDIDIDIDIGIGIGIEISQMMLYNVLTLALLDINQQIDRK